MQILLPITAEEMAQEEKAQAWLARLAVLVELDLQVSNQDRNLGQHELLDEKPKKSSAMISRNLRVVEIWRLGLSWERQVKLQQELNLIGGLDVRKYLR
jgi:hypothetical protein